MALRETQKIKCTVGGSKTPGTVPEKFTLGNYAFKDRINIIYIAKEKISQKLRVRPKNIVFFLYRVSHVLTSILTKHVYNGWDRFSTDISHLLIL